MIVDFPYRGYEDIAPTEVPDANLLGVYAPRTLDEVDAHDVVARGIANPIGAARLREAVRRSARVLILVDDVTRGTPVAVVLRYVIEELEAAGVSDDRIVILTAQGTHRRMTEIELREKLGVMRDRFVVHQHDWRDDAALHDFGQTSDGTRVTANRLLARTDFTLGIGSIAPHRIKGFSGGAKIAFPGVAGREMRGGGPRGLRDRGVPFLADA